MRTHCCRKQPSANDVVCLWSNIHREDVVKQLLIINPSARNLRCKRRRCPCVHDVWFAHESTSDTALCFGETGWNVGTWVDWKLRFAWNDWVIEVRFACGGKWIPQRNGNSEVTLATNEPVAVEPTHPVGVAVLHEVGVPCKFVAALQQCGAQYFITTTVADVPLTAGHNFEWAVAFFKELHRVSNWLWFAIHVAACAQHVNDCRLRLLHTFASKCCIVGSSCC